MHKYIFILVCSSLFFISKSDFEIVYGDSGFMWIQIMDLIQGNFTSFSFKYSGEIFDANGVFLPFVDPFIGRYQQYFYIVFSPYFPLITGLTKFIFNSNLSIYLLELIGIIIALNFFFLILQQHVKSRINSIIITFILLFCSTIFTYNLVIHEYSLAIAMLYSGLYFFEFNLDKKDISIFYSSILLGLSLFLRLEFIFPIFSWIIVSLLYKKFSFYYVAIQFGIAFLTIIISLFIFNFIIYGHPLGFRYLLTMTNPEIMMIPRSEIITDLLFGRLRGFFYQSPYLLLFLIIGTFQIVLSRINKKSICKEQEFYFLITIFILLLISFTAPNHGDHLSPRYLFGIYPSFFLFSYYTYNITKTKLKRNFLLLFHLLIIVLILFSVKQLYKNIKFISDSDKLVRSLTDKVSEQKEQNIVFLDQVLAKNLQTINYTKNLYYSKPEDISNFLKVSKIDKSNILFISTEYSSQCILDFKLCKDRNSFNSLNFYKYQDN